jgi:hypothetical protein
MRPPRRTDVSRLEAFSDAVSAFSHTLPVMPSGVLPRRAPIAAAA